MKLMRTIMVVATAAFLVVGASVCLGQETKAPAKADTTKAKAHEYVGVGTCKMCHSGEAKGAIFETWSKTKHATAFANLPAEAKKNTKCFACHTTGYGKPGGYDPASANAAKLEGVTCEACHGPGKDYKSMSVMKDKKQAMAAGLIAPDATTCKVCHEGAVPEGHKERPKFEFATMVKLIEHHLPKK
jgi:hypothetical protein